jgi:hypothetical protein
MTKSMLQRMNQSWRIEREPPMNVERLRAKTGIALRLTLLLCWLLLASRPADAIVGPVREAPDLAPFVVMLLNAEDGHTSFCSASVIARDVVLTAAHCVARSDETRIQILNEQGKPELFDVATVAIHPGFQPDAARRRLLSIDLALVRLADPLPARFRPAELPRSGTLNLRQTFRIAGFGVSHENLPQSGGVLRVADVIATGSRSPVLMWLKDPYGRGTGACTGDSGAPVFAERTPLLEAVAVWARGENGHRCGTLTQAVLVGPQMAWIDRVLLAWGATRTSRP